MADTKEILDYSEWLVINDRRIDPGVIGLIAVSLVPGWELLSRLNTTTEGGVLPSLRMRRAFGPFNDEMDHNTVLGGVADFLRGGRLGHIMEGASANLVQLPAENGFGNEPGLAISGPTPPNGMYSNLLFGKLMQVDLALTEAVPQIGSRTINLDTAITLIGGPSNS